MRYCCNSLGGGQEKTKPWKNRDLRGHLTKKKGRRGVSEWGTLKKIPMWILPSRWKKNHRSREVKGGAIKGRTTPTSSGDHYRIDEKRNKKTLGCA